MTHPFENEPQYVAHAKTDAMDEFVPVLVTIDSEPEARVDVATQHRGVSPDNVTIDRIEER
jgi:hypothetical protein